MDTTHDSVKLSFKHIPDNTHKALEILAQEDWLKENGWYLAGGTALALQCDHRISVDLDFFTSASGFDENRIISALTSFGWTTSLLEKGTLYGELSGAKISFIVYPYFSPAQPFISYKFINVLDASDIAVMKIVAISQRGKKRDFFDLYWYIVNREPLVDVLKRVKDRYPHSNHNYHHIIKSLIYFEEAEEDPQPQIFFNATWEQVKQHFIGLIPSVTNKFL